MAVVATTTPVGFVVVAAAGDGLVSAQDE